MELNTRVIKEPRGFIRIIQIIFAIFAFATTSGFKSSSKLDIVCFDGKKPVTEPLEYQVDYPFTLDKNEFTVSSSCNDSIDGSSKIKRSFPMDFSSSARFFVTTGVLCMLYGAGALAFYTVSAAYYETNPLIPILDLAATTIFTIFWFAGSCAWAAGVSDLKYYTNPGTFKKHLIICKETEDTCTTNSLANWASLNVSLIFGFANFFLWGASIWFVYKETQFHPKPMAGPIPPGGPPGPNYPPQSQDSFGSYGDPIGGQQKPVQYPNTQQYPGQY